jgi:hypothetical protein
MQDKAREIVSVLDFGAVGNGTTDDTDAFQTTASLGKLALIPKSVLGYKFTSPFTPKGAAWFPDPAMTWGALTDSGKFSILKGTRQNQTDGANIWRFADRVFIGDAADKLTGDDGNAQNDSSKSWFGNTVNYAGYLGRNGKLVISSSPNYPSSIGYDIPYGIAVGMRGSDTGQEVIGVASHIVTAGSGLAALGWGFIAELQNEGASACYGLEVAAKNKAATDTTLTPRTPGGYISGVYGVWLAAGGDSTFGGAPTFPSTAAVVIQKNASTWNTGIVFIQNALTNGRAISLSGEATGGNHYIEWMNAAGNSNFNILSSRTVAQTIQLLCDNNGLKITKNGVPAFLADAPNSANVNYIGVFGSETNVPPQINSQGADTNIDLFLSPKGTGRVRFGTFASTGDVACNGYIEIKDAAGNTRKIMTTA